METSSRQSQTSRVITITVMFGLFFIISFVTGLQNPFAVIVKEQFATNNLLSQLGNFANFIAYACMGLPAGMLLARVGYRRTALYATVVGLIGVLLMLLSGGVKSFPIYLCGALISGFAMCMLNTVVNPMLNNMGKTAEQGNQLIQFGGVINSIGATLAPILVGYLVGGATQNKTIASASLALYVALIIFAIAFIVLFFTKLSETEVSRAQFKIDGYSALSFRHFKLGIIAIFIYVGIEVGIPNIVNLYITSPLSDTGLGMETTIAGSVVGTYWLLMLVGRLVGGTVGARVGSRSMLITSAMIALGLVVSSMIIPQNIEVLMPVFQSNLSFSLVKIPLTITLLTCCGLCTSVMWGCIFNIATSGLGRYTPIASGLFMMMVCGGGVLPLIQGWIADMSSFRLSYIVTSIGLLYLLIYAIAGYRNVNKNIPVE